MTRRIAIIPARGGSKRLPRKNLLPFLGRPIIAHTIETAHACRCFDRVVVSTEDPEIVEAARSAGAEVSVRPTNLATDAARVVDVCLDLLATEERAGRSYDVFACLYATAPLRRSDDVAAVMAMLEDEHADFAMAITTFPIAPHQAMKIGRTEPCRRCGPNSSSSAPARTMAAHMLQRSLRFATANPSMGRACVLISCRAIGLSILMKKRTTNLLVGMPKGHLDPTRSGPQHPAAQIIDFNRSQLVWTTTAGSNGHWRLIAAASLLSREGHLVDRYVLAPRLMAGEVYATGRLMREPPYSFQIFASSHQHTMLREAVGSAARAIVIDTSDDNKKEFRRLEIRFAAAKGVPMALETLSTERVVAFWPLAATIEAVNLDGDRWLLEFPIDHINATNISNKPAFQVETGPILVPQALVRSPPASVHGGFALAYAFFNRADRVDLAVWGFNAADKAPGRDFHHFDRLDPVTITVFSYPQSPPYGGNSAPHVVLPMLLPKKIQHGAAGGAEPPCGYRDSCRFRC